jgi:hypothetical protein
MRSRLDLGRQQFSYPLVCVKANRSFVGGIRLGPSLHLRVQSRHDVPFGLVGYDRLARVAVEARVTMAPIGGANWTLASASLGIVIWLARPVQARRLESTISDEAEAGIVALARVSTGAIADGWRGLVERQPVRAWAEFTPRGCRRLRFGAGLRTRGVARIVSAQEKNPHRSNALHVGSMWVDIRDETRRVD